MVPLVILIVILIVLRRPDCSRFGQITSCAKGDADNHVTATPQLRCPVCQACLARLCVGKRSFLLILFGDGVWSQRRRENHQKVSCASKSVPALLVLAGDIELNPGPLRNASSFLL